MPIGEPAGHKEEFTGQKKEEMGMHYIPFPPFLSTTPSTFQIDSLFLLIFYMTLFLSLLSFHST